MSIDDMFLEADIVNDLIDEGRPATTYEKIRAAIKVECDRQHVGEDRQEMLYNIYMQLHGDHEYRVLRRSDITHLAYEIEPDNNGQYRTTPVGFNGVVGGVLQGNIERAMKSWLEWFNHELDLVDRQDSRVDQVIKEFLDIHPFSDGNGRTAWLLRVWMLNQWNDPQPLPDYYGVSDETSSDEALDRLRARLTNPTKMIAITMEKAG